MNRANIVSTKGSLILMLFLIHGLVTIHAQPKTDELLENILFNNGTPLVSKIAGQKDTFRLQIIYTQINRDKRNNPSFVNYFFNVDPDLYFNPASTVKLPLAFLSLEKLNQINQSGVNKFTAMQFDSSYVGQVKAYEDDTARDNLPSIAHYIKKAFLVSDNDAYNRMYQFVGQGTINQNLRTRGFLNTKIIRQFMGFSEEQNRHTNQIRFIDKNGHVLYTQPPAYNPDQFDFTTEIKIGKGHMNRYDSLIYEPIDFTRANKVGLEDLQRMLQSVMFPLSVPAAQRFNLTKDDYTFLYQYLSQYSSETNYPKYDAEQYYDSYVKFYFRDESRQMPAHVRVFNKVGWAYGFLTDVSYVADFKNKVEFMLTTTLYVNSDGILNDNKYDYDDVGWPFLYQLGQTIYQYELNRPRAIQRDLKQFKIRYEERDPKDMRATIKDVDN